MYSYTGFKVKQRRESEIEFITFIAKAKDVYDWSHADSIVLDKEGVQRDLVKARWKRITKFFDSSSNNIIPNSVIIAFDDSIIDSIKLEEIDIENEPTNLTKISFDNNVKDNTYIIDGQHRLKGISEYEPEDIFVVVTLFLGISKLERAFQFITINNKSHKVPTDNIKALIHNFDSQEDEESFQIRLSTASITAGKFSTVIDVFNESEDSPFYKLLDWPNNRTGKKLIKPLALETVLKSVIKYFPEMKNDNDDILMDIIFNIWKPIKEYYVITFDNIEEYRNLFTKTVIIAISEYIISKLSDQIIFSEVDELINKSENVCNLTSSLISGIDKSFWTDEWTYKSLDSQGGRKMIIEDIVQIKRNIRSGRDWNENIKLLSDIPDDE